MRLHEVQSWCVDLDVAPDCHALLHATLSVEERGRCARLRLERDRRRFVVAHGALRQLLARQLETQPHRIDYVCAAFGKPALSPALGSELKFNLSHSGDRALIALAEA